MLFIIRSNDPIPLAFPPRLFGNTRGEWIGLGQSEAWPYATKPPCHPEQLHDLVRQRWRKRRKWPPVVPDRRNNTSSPRLLKRAILDQRDRRRGPLRGNRVRPYKNCAASFARRPGPDEEFTGLCATRRRHPSHPCPMSIVVRSRRALPEEASWAAQASEPTSLTSAAVGQLWQRWCAQALATFFTPVAFEAEVGDGARMQRPWTEYGLKLGCRAWRTDASSAAANVTNYSAGEGRNLPAPAVAAP